MRTALVLAAAFATAVSLSACKKPAGNGASNASGGASTASASDGGGSGGGELTAANMPHRKIGLWKISMTGIPGVGAQSITECVGPNTDKDIGSFAARGSAVHDCTHHYTRGLDGTIDGETTCTHNGITSTMKTHITGDFGSHYHMHIDSTTTGPVTRTMSMEGDATWAGPCTPSATD